MQEIKTAFIMKKLLILILIIVSISSFINAQVSPHAIGIRFGGNGDINGVEVSYQQGFSKLHRLELDLGFGGNSHQNRFLVAGIYHWDWNMTGGLNWYIGPGAGIGYYSNDDANDYLNLAIGGQIGLEYNFNTLKTPLLLSLDYRPMWDFASDNAGFGWGLALGVRFTW